jgi:hypothetical protein
MYVCISVLFLAVELARFTSEAIEINQRDLLFTVTELLYE